MIYVLKKYKRKKLLIGLFVLSVFVCVILLLFMLLLAVPGIISRDTLRLLQIVVSRRSTERCNI